MNLANAGIYLWLILYPINVPIKDNHELERTWFKFDKIEECVEYADESDFIFQKIREKDGWDWVFAFCLNPMNGQRTYILPTYQISESNPTGSTPIEMQDVIVGFEKVMIEMIIPAVTGIKPKHVPKKKFIFKSY